MKDWEMAEHFAERDGVRMASGQHIQAPESMIERARRIVAQGYDGWEAYDRPWAEALLAEHEDCERLDAALVEAMERAEEAERRVDRIKDENVVQRERDGLREVVASWQHIAASEGQAHTEAEARVADLEAALRVTAAGELAWLRGFLSDAYAMQQVKNAQDRLLAVLGKQEATPPEPPEPDEEYRAWQRAAEAPTVYSQPLPASAPQGEAEPTFCRECGGTGGAHAYSCDQEGHR